MNFPRRKPSHAHGVRKSSAFIGTPLSFFALKTVVLSRHHQPRLEFFYRRFVIVLCLQ